MNTYYEYQYDLIERVYPATVEEIDLLLLNKLDEVLSKKDQEAEWLANHYIGAVDALYDCGEVSEDVIENLKKSAKEEIRIFEKNGFSREALAMKRMLKEFDE